MSVSKLNNERTEWTRLDVWKEQGEATTGVVDWSSLHRVLTVQTTLSAISCLNCHPLISIRPSYPKAERTDLGARAPSTCPLACTHSYNSSISESSWEATDPPTPQSHYRGKIIIGGSYGIRHPSTSCRIELMLTISIFVLTNVAAMYTVLVHDCNLFKAERCTALLADFIWYHCYPQ